MARFGGLYPVARQGGVRANLTVALLLFVYAGVADIVGNFTVSGTVDFKQVGNDTAIIPRISSVSDITGASGGITIQTNSNSNTGGITLDATPSSTVAGQVIDMTGTVVSCPTYFPPDISLSCAEDNCSRHNTLLTEVYQPSADAGRPLALAAASYVLQLARTLFLGRSMSMVRWRAAQGSDNWPGYYVIERVSNTIPPRV